MARGRRVLESLEDDIRDHIERETRDNLDRGMAPEEARRQALLKFGNVALVKEDTRAIWRWQRVEQLAQDSWYAVRILRRRPVYALLSVLTLALGIGGTAAVFGVAHGVLLSPLPYAHERELGVFWMKTDWTHEEYLHIRGRTPGFREVALYRQRDAMLRVGGGPARLVPAVAASSELLDVLGAAPMLGRGFREGDDVPGAERVALLSFGLWQELGGSPGIIGTYLTLDGRPRSVIGVMPRGFWFPDPSVRIWTPEPLRADSRSWNSTLIGRVAPDRELGALEAPLARLAAMLDERFDYTARDKTKDRRITPVRDDLLGPMQPALVATLAATALILLIGCANVAALVLGQVDARSVEFAVRSALGANRQRLAQQLIVEVLIVAAVAGVLGSALAWVGFTVVTDALPLGAWAGAAPDWRVFASAMAIAVIAASLVILAPIVSLYRGDLRRVLSAARMGGIAGRGGRLESGLVVAQVALAVMIASGAALLARSVANMYAVQPGVRVDGVAVVDVVFDGTLDRASREKMLDELERALRELPGVASVGAAQQLPLRGGGYRAGLRIDERPEIENAATEYRIVTPGYFESLGFALRRGRAISGDDRTEAERVVVVNEAFARRYFPGVDPIGRSIGGDVEQARSRIVGVVADAAEKRLTDAAEPVRYVALAQIPWIDDAHSIVLRTAPGATETSLLEPARRTIARVAPSAAVQQTTTMRRVLDTSVGSARQVVSLLSLLTGLALILGAVGVYGVMTHFATRRRRDWAIRIAIGLPSSRVVAGVLGHGAMLVSAGIVAGIVGAAMLTRLLSSFLFDVSALDPIAFATAGAALFAVGVAAAFVPALRTGMADPLKALREQ
ncbi:MAG: ADOP family duplicated permease [Burkholderiales bacterium]